MNRRFLLKVTVTSLSVLTLFSQVAVAEENIHFSSCKEAWAHGYSDMREGEPGYSAKLDRDHDGVACELKNAPQGAFKPRKSTEVKSNSSSAVTSGWVQKDGVWYYYDEQGNPVTNTWKGSYYLKSDGKMAQSEWIYDASYQSWYYLKSDGSYARNEWQGSYYLKSNGKMAQSEWIYDASYQSWYYLKSDGSYARNEWQGSYYLKSNGKMAQSEWIYDASYQSWYYLKSDGSYARNEWQGSYYLKSNGKMAQSEWVYDASYQSWYYLKSDGSYARNEWQGSYYLKSNGKMAQSEWVYDKSYQSWYYLKSDGSYARNAWQGSYYLKSDGKMAVNEWVDGGRYYVDGSGLWNSNSDSNTKVTNKGLYYSVQGKYDEILVVNKHYPLSKDYNPGENPTAKAAFLKLIAQMQKEGYAVSDNYSGFRSYATQAKLYQSYVNREGQAAADRYSARPGYSEHQTGLAFDVIGTNGHLVEDESAAQWLLDHAADYGFVVRYLKGKESVTGYMHEEWHLRYVGKEAKEIAASGLTLEEYYGFDGGDYLN